MAENRQQQEIKEITDKLEQGIQELFESDRYKEFLSCMSKFHNYSLNNQMLIAMQKPDASLIAGYNSWIEKHHRYVLKGEHGIRILAPMKKKIPVEKYELDPATKEPKRDKDGNPLKRTDYEERVYYKPVSVFDVSQTDGEPIPELGVRELSDDVEEYELFFETLKRTCPVPIEFEKIASGAKGYYNLVENRIAINEGMSEAQNVKTAIHEMAHQKLHSKEVLKSGEKLSSNVKEVEAESIAYTVCQHYGIDTSDYSFSYIAGWSEGKETPELKASLNRIRTAASEMITDIDKNIEELRHELEVEEKRKITFEIKIQEPVGFKIATLHGTADMIEPVLLEMQKEETNGQIVDVEGYLSEHGLEVDHLCDSSDSGSLKYAVTTYEYDREQNVLFRCGSVLGIDGQEIIGETSFASGEEFRFTDKEAYLKEIRDEIEYQDASGFHYHTVTLNPEVRKAVADIVLNLFGKENVRDVSFYEVSTEKLLEQSKEAKAFEIAVYIDQIAYDSDLYEYRDKIDNRESFIQEIRNDLLSGSERVREIREWFTEIQEDMPDAETVVEMIDAFTDNSFATEKEQSISQEEEGSISFYVAECMEYPEMGELHEGLTLKEAVDIYEKIPAERLNAGKGIGFDLQDESDYAGKFDLMQGGRIEEEIINRITHFRNSSLVQDAIKECKEELINRGIYRADDIQQGACLIGEDKYLSIQRASDESWDYTLYDKDYQEIDGGQIGDFSMSFSEARNEILESFDLMEEKLTSINPDTLENQVQFAEAKRLHDSGYVMDGCVLRSEASVRVDEIMDMCAVSQDRFSTEQLKVIYEAAKLEVSLTSLMHPELSAEQLTFALDLMKQGKDAEAVWVGGKNISVVDHAMNTEDISSIKRQMQYDSVPKMIFSPEQWKEIESAMKHNLDVTILTNPDYTATQMKELRIGLDKGIDITMYSSPEFDSKQMREVRRGLEAGFDVSTYASPDISAGEMRKAFFAIKDGANALKMESKDAVPDKDTGMYRYYSTQRPVSPGTYPGKPVKVENFDSRKKVENGKMEAWGYVEYTQPLSEKEASDYELKPALVEAVAEKQASISLPKKQEKKEKKPSLLANLHEKQKQIAKESKPKSKTPVKEERD